MSFILSCCCRSGLVFHSDHNNFIRSVAKLLAQCDLHSVSGKQTFLDLNLFITCHQDARLSTWSTVQQCAKCSSDVRLLHGYQITSHPPLDSNDTDAHNKYASVIKRCILRLLRPLISMIFMIIMLHEELFFFSHVYVLEEKLWSSLLWSKEHSEHNLHDFLPVFIL